jgi:hypothetical protein
MPTMLGLVSTVRASRRAAGGLAAVTLVALGLAGCGTPNLPCPNTRILSTAEREVRIAPPGAPNQGKIQYVGQIKQAKLACSYDPNTYERLTVAMGVQITAALGPGAVDRTAEFEYFVAVMNLSGEVIGKKVFPLKIAFPPGQDEVTKVEAIDQVIPLKYPQNGGSLEIWTGFQLTDDELKFNRQHF